MAKIRKKDTTEGIREIKRGEIYLVAFDPTIGHEINNTRPALIIQNNIGNRFSPITIVAAISSKIPENTHPVQITVEPTQSNGLQKISSIRLNQIRSIDHARIIHYIGYLDSKIMDSVDQALKISLGLVEF